MAKVGEIIGAAALVAGAVALDVTSMGAGLGLTSAEIASLSSILGSMGASMAMAGIAGLLEGTPPGHGIASQNPIKPWDVCYGQVKVDGTIVMYEPNGGILSNGSNTYDKCNNFVVMLACHPIQSVDQVRLNGKVLPLGAGGHGSQSTTWSYTPASNQNQTGIASISRASGVVTIKLNSALTGQNGLQFNVQHVNDNSFNGIYTVAQPNASDNTTFTYLCGGPDTTSSGGYIYTCYPDYGNRVHCDLTSCLGNHTATFPEYLSTTNLWTPAHINKGRASVYIAFYYDSTHFPQGIPNMSFVLTGKNNIYDPRTNTYGYTNNAALVIADYLSNKAFGFGLSYGTDIPTAQLIAAANICDEQIALAAGGTEAQYTINMRFDLSRGRGEVLQDMLNACGARLSVQNGQYIILPAAWVGPSVSLTQANLVGPIEYKPIMSVREACNGVKGTYTSPVNQWQPGDIPPYCEDTLHGYTSDRWLTADGGERIWKDVTFPATTSVSTAQRLAKITLERIRREGRLTLHCDASAFAATVGDVVEFTYLRYNWTNKTFEVLRADRVCNPGPNGEAPALQVDLELAETDATFINWSTSEELTPEATAYSVTNNQTIAVGPQFVELESGPTTAYVGTDGVVQPRILASWLSAPDATVLQGYIRIEYQKVGDTLWTPAGTVGGDQTQCYISGVVSGQQYNVQIQGFRANGVGAGWTQAGPVTVSANSTSLAASSVTYPDGTPVANLQPAQAGADVTADQPISYVGAGQSIVPNGDFILGSTKGWVNASEGDAATWAYNVGSDGPEIQDTGGSGNFGVTSPTFSVVPGAKYRLTFRASCSAGTQSIYFRIRGSATYKFNTDPGTYSNDFLTNGTIAVDTYTDYSYDWVCPAGVYYASMLAYNWNNSSSWMHLRRVSCIPYAGVNQWGADVTGSNTSANTNNVGSVSSVQVENASASIGLVGKWWRVSSPPAGGGDLAQAPLFTTQDAALNYVMNVSGGAAYAFANQVAPPIPSDGNGWPQLYARWTGYFVAPTTGTYTIGVNSDDGANLYVNGVQLVSDLPNGHTANADLTYKNSGTIALTAGVLYPIVIEYHNGDLSGAIQLLWTLPSATSPTLLNVGSAQTNTQNIVAGAVSSQIAMSSTTIQFVNQSTETVLGTVTLGTSGGYVKVYVNLQIAGNSSSTTVPAVQSFPDLYIYKGAMGGTVLAEMLNLDVANNDSDTYSGYTSVTLMGVDTSPALAQQYTVTVESGNSGLECAFISVVAENMKV